MLLPPVPQMTSVKIFPALTAEPLRRRRDPPRCYSVSVTLAASNACSANVSASEAGL